MLIKMGVQLARHALNGISSDFFLMLWLHRRFVLQLGTANFIQMIFENLTCIAGNCFDGLWVRQLTLTRTSRAIQYFIHGTTGLINNWNTMVSRYGQRNICLSIGILKITLLCLMKIAGWSASYIGTQEVEGLDGHFSNGKLQYKFFAAGIGSASGLILRKATISGSSTTRTLFPLFSYDNDAIFISSCIVCKYCTLFLRLTSCALNGPPLGRQDQSQKK